MEVVVCPFVVVVDDKDDVEYVGVNDAVGGGLSPPDDWFTCSTTLLLWNEFND